MFLLIGGYITKEIHKIEDVMFYKYIMALFFGIFFIGSGIENIKKNEKK
jgi:hypothetical protein